MDAASEIPTETPTLDLLSLIIKCGFVAAAFTAVVWLITSYSLDWAFFR